MRVARSAGFATALCALGLFVSGCDLSSKKEPEKQAAKPGDGQVELHVDVEKTTSTPDTGAKSSKVVLGSPELTAGIPGKGPLTEAEATAWFDNPVNQEPLEITLPMGLDAGTSAIDGLGANPLTRAKIELGRQLYFDPRLSGDGTVSCASCHHPAEGFAKHTQFGVGVRNQTGGRNSPVSYNRILSGPQFWDGRAGSLEDQAKGPIANPIEMDNKHDACVACIKGVPAYAKEFEKVFPDGVTIDNVAKAIASFERALVTGPSPYDYFVAVDKFKDADLDDLKNDDPASFEAYEKAKKELEKHPFSDSAKRGKELFFSEKVNCTACHVGANFTDEKYHNLGVGMDQPEDKQDKGRMDVTKDPKDLGAFKTPTIRNVSTSAPYMHDGSQKTLAEVVEWYNKGGHKNPNLDEKVKPLNLTDQEKADLVEFMNACTGDFPLVEAGRLPE